MPDSRMQNKVSNPQSSEMIANELEAFQLNSQVPILPASTTHKILGQMIHTGKDRAPVVLCCAVSQPCAGNEYRRIEDATYPKSEREHS